MHYLAFCCMAKDEAPYIKEWLAYHALLGVEHFYIYDNCSATPIRDLLGEFADSSRVTIRRIPGERMQLLAYEDCLQSFGSACQWIGFLDLDEFALPMQEEDLRVLLAEFEDYGGLAATWHLFGASGHEARPEGPVISNYTQAFAVQESYQIKSFVRPARTLRCPNVHYFEYSPGYYCVNEDHYPVSPRVQCTFAPGHRVRVNHYFMKSREDFAHKVRRGGGIKGRSADWHSMDIFDAASAKPCVEDRAICRFLPRLEKALAKDSLPLPSPLFPVDISGEALVGAATAFANAGEYIKALACLCHGNPEHTANADFWTLRALLASALGQNRRAEIFLRQSLIREPSQPAYALLQTLMERANRPDLVCGIRTILDRYPQFFT